MSRSTRFISALGGVDSSREFPTCPNPVMLIPSIQDVIVITPPIPMEKINLVVYFLQPVYLLHRAF